MNIPMVRITTTNILIRSSHVFAECGFSCKVCSRTI
jgi:hypothetical protein